MTNIAANIHRIAAELPQGVALVAVSKFHPVEELRRAYDAGQRLFGENRAQELVAKAPQLPPDVQWHFLGHLQRNKVRMIMPWVSVIQSIDSVELLRLVDKEAGRAGRRVSVLIQLHVAQEQAKTGFTVEEALQAARDGAFDNLQNVTIAGVMAMATFTPDRDQVAREFELVRHTFAELKAAAFAQSPEFKEISMGMSDDRDIAVAHGATMVRVGTDIFGPRQY